MRKYKILLVIGDGLGDRPVTSLGGMTPLQYARKPNIDKLLKTSIVGLMDPISPGVIPGSDTSHLAIFGLDPYKYYRGRGAFEALGAGAQLKHGDVAFRGNFATVDNNMIVKDRRAGRKLDEGQALVDELNQKIGTIDDVKVSFYKGTEHRVAVVLSGDSLSDKVGDTDPHEVGKRVKESEPIDGSHEAKRTSSVLNKLTEAMYKVLNESEINKERVKKGELPANIVLVRGAASYVKLPKLSDYAGLRGATVAATALIKGICKELGMNVVTPPGATGGIDTDYDSKANTAIDFLKSDDYDLVFLHIKATDAASHDGKIQEKVKAIEKIDYVIGKILDAVGDDMIIALTGDHSTPVEKKEHAGDPVPIFIHVPYPISYDSVEDFNEIDAKKGSLKIRGLDILNLLLNYSQRAEKYGA
ncbi:2,3-bisphosphoglycerate-independent phosphoglycerate mutase [Sulfuracidifex metallicus]|uniref:2,3-bisphosphoglycerate-independent phosphoglycerate mutase n=1 Tax=Sulfuracidifex metallicus DSM 6482 = JCM 9184 TaxID=523847 RepID=A0A6A9QT27_SULME|nr:2,3-bisphosphoglycerate-independent phosphoglycerate mutase [Sulfuracidifex metallicus]MUN28302.1 2,3-bisphosphoglycerate-independent phosphoglycerate mutase [Sulfuracidifex metallicus DSM 6482 = JCM 9184]WOE51167.1 2,3-bisphosphoglycerate-independent phosphoglycerate mutase [Sulfuracidifex metallicus DSM 6482 = JCM 9184]